MNKQALFVTLAFIATAGLAAGAQTAPADSADQSAGLLTSPVVEPTNEDPAVQKAVKWILMKRGQTNHLVNVAPKSRTAHKEIDKTLILGYPDTMPM
ncbi:MAG TPA: hypothetical protein V6D22_25375 [Candidatus Obscuribacterales bacterium]